MGTVLLRIESLSVAYLARIGRGEAVRNLDLEIGRREVVGLVGESGCGKSTLGWSILRLLPKTGRIINGRIIFEDADLLKLPENSMATEIRGKKIAMIVQSPQTALNPVFQVGTQMADVLRLRSKSRKSKRMIGESVTAILREMGIADAEQRKHEYPFQFSGGMNQRVMMALAFVTEPSLLIADEPTTGLDITVEAQVLSLLKKTVQNRGTSLLYITHDLGVISEIADKVCVMYAGRIVESARVGELFSNPCHPYTKMLFDCLPQKNTQKGDLTMIKGSVPSIFHLPEGCAFHPRCPHATELCGVDDPPMREGASSHAVACHHPIAA